jgi:hypothetical protein
VRYDIAVMGGIDALARLLRHDTARLPAMRALSACALHGMPQQPCAVRPVSCAAPERAVLAMRECDALATVLTVLSLPPPQPGADARSAAASLYDPDVAQAGLLALWRCAAVGARTAGGIPPHGMLNTARADMAAREDLVALGGVGVAGAFIASPLCTEALGMLFNMAAIRTNSKLGFDSTLTDAGNSQGSSGNGGGWVPCSRSRGAARRAACSRSDQQRRCSGGQRCRRRHAPPPLSFRRLCLTWGGSAGQPFPAGDTVAALALHLHDSDEAVVVRSIRALANCGATRMSAFECV